MIHVSNVLISNHSRCCYPRYRYRSRARSHRGYWFSYRYPIVILKQSYVWDRVFPYM